VRVKKARKREWKEEEGMKERRKRKRGRRAKLSIHPFPPLRRKPEKSS